MPTPSYLSTFLWSQQLRGADAFAAKYVGEWLVWEPGPWQAPARNTMSTLKVDSSSATPQQGDALCFFLGSANGRTLMVGREPGSDVLISDGTVSRQHAALVGQNGGWSVKVAPGRAASLGGLAIPETGVLLLPGKMLQLGGVSLSFHDCTSLLRRLVQ
jgi:Inner membrane component of T3SS, cytoplasmic domain